MIKSSISLQLAILILLLSAFIRYRLSSLGVSPVSYTLPGGPDLPIFPSSKKSSSGKLTGKVEKVGIDDLKGPESLVTSIYRGREYLFASLADGRVVRLTTIEEETDGSWKNGDEGLLSWTTVVRTGEGIVSSSSTSNNANDDDIICGHGGPSDTTNTENYCGRPLGMKIVKRSTVVNVTTTATTSTHDDNNDDDDVLIIADAYRGLLMISNIYHPHHNQGNIHILATRALTDDDDYSFQLLNGIVQVDNHTIYMTETSRQFQRRRIFHAVFDGRPTGRLLKYTTTTGVGVVQVVVDNLYMPNGLALSHDGMYLLVVSGVQILKYSLITHEMMEDDDHHPFVILPGTGDNIDRMPYLPSGIMRDCYWAALGSKVAQPFSLLKAVSDKPWLKSLLCAVLPYGVLVELIPKLSALVVYGLDGELIDVYRDDEVVAPWLSEGEIMGGYLYLGSWYNSFLARVRLSDLS